MDDKNFNLVKLDSKLAEKIYDDVFSTSFQKAGNALGDVIGLVTSITLPIAMFNNFTNYILQKNIKKYEEKLNNIKEEDRIKVSPEIGVPILDKLTYYENDKLSDLFLELLKKASNKNEISEVHPKYIKIIENLSEDEAIILNYIKVNNFYNIPFLDIHQVNKKDNSYNLIYQYISNLSDIKDLNFPQKINDYIENLSSLGIFYIPQLESFADKNIYNALKNKDFIVNLQNQINQNEEALFRIDLKERKIDITQFGKNFLKAIY